MKVQNIAPELFKLLPTIRPYSPKGSPIFNPIDLFNNIQNLRGVLIQWKMNINNYSFRGTQPVDNPYRQYLEFGVLKIKELATSIVNPSDTDDVKMQKIQEWVMRNITYVSDLKNYGSPEYWALPTQTLHRKSGDCEDGAFLIHSLALNAGVSPERLRTYGGLVKTDDATAPLGGHAWTAYKRQVDNKWVLIDWCYNPDTRPIAQRGEMRDDDKYIDDWFWVNFFQTYNASLTNDLAANIRVGVGKVVDVRV